MRPNVPFFLCLLLLLLKAAAGHAQFRYWDADYDSLRRTLVAPRPLADSARLRTLVHLLDITELTDLQRRERALPLLDELLRLNQRTHLLPDERPYRLLRRGVGLWLQNKDMRMALRCFYQAIELFDAAGHPAPRLLIDLGPVFNALKASDERFVYFQRKLTQYQRQEARHNEAACYLVLAGSYRHRGDQNQAISHYLKAAELFQEFERSYYITEIMATGSAYAEWGNHRKALEYLHKAMALEDQYHFEDMRRFFTLQALARVYLQQQRYPEALRYANRSLQVAQHDSLIRQSGTAYALVLKSAVLVQQHPEQAYPLLVRAQQLADSLRMNISGRLGEFPLDATWARYYQARGQYDQAEAHWLAAYRKATSSKLNLLRPHLLEQLLRFYDLRQQPEQLQRYTRIYLTLSDSLSTAHNAYNIAQYEGERVALAQSAQIANLRQAQAVQAVRLRQRGLLLGFALGAVVLVSGLGVVLYRQLRVNKRTLARLRQTQNQLVAAEKWAFVGEVSAGIAHELQNPLHFMKRFADVSATMLESVQRDGRPPAGQASLEQEILTGLKQNLQEISQHGRRASSIIKDMLEHSRTGTTQRQLTDLNALVGEQVLLAYEAVQGQHPGFQAAIELELEPQLPPVNLVPQDVARVLLNLLTNAFHAVRHRQQTDDPQYAPEVRISTRQRTGRVEIRVRDNGPGISEAVKERVFQPFFTTKPVGEGSGLGLSLSHDIVTKGHGGTLRVETQEGQFAEFIVTLPG
ncbi:ATP-binding protein [Hymenobacter coalescens]